MRPTWYWFKRTLLGVLMLVLIVLAIAGSNLSLQLARLTLPSLVPGFQLGQVSGDLWRGAVFEQLGFDQDGLSVRIGRLETKLNWRCFSSNGLCLDYLRLQVTSVTYAPVPEPSPAVTAAETATATATTHAMPPQTAPADTSVSRLPALWYLVIDELQLDGLQLDSPQLQLQLQQLQSAGRLNSKELQLGSSQLQGVKVVLPAVVATDPTANLTLPAIKQLPLPVAVAIQGITLADVTVFQGKQQLLALEKSQLNALLQPALWHLQLTEFNASQPRIDLTAKLHWQETATSSFASQFAVILPELLPDLRLQGSTSGPLQQLAVLLDLTGAQQAKLTGEVNLTKPQLPFQLSLQSEVLTWPLQGPAQSAPATADGTTAAAVTPATPELYQASNIKLQVSGDLQQQQLTGQLNARLPELPNLALQLDAGFQPQPGLLTIAQLKVQTLGGDIRLQGQYNLPNQQLSSQWQLQNIQPGLYWTDYEGEFSGDFGLTLQLQPQLQLALQQLNIRGQLRDLPLDLTGALQLKQQPDHWQLHTQQLLLQHGPNSIQASGGLDPDWKLALEVDISDLAATIAQSEGSIKGNVQLSGPAAKPVLQLNLLGSGLNYQDDYSLQTLTLRGNIADWGRQDSQLSLVLTQGQAPGFQLQQLDWQLQGNRLQHNNHLIVDSHQLQAVLAMTGRFDGTTWQANWDELRLKSDVGDWQLQQPAQSQWQLAAAQLTLSPVCFIDQQASVCLQPLTKMALAKGDVRLVLDKFELTALNALLSDEQSLTGTVQGQLDFGWRPGQIPTAKLQLSGDAGKFYYQSATLLEMPWQQLNIAATLQPQSLNATVRLGFANDRLADLQLELTDLASTQRQLQARLKLQRLDLAFLQPMFSEFSQFSAELDGDITASGALTNPLLQGRLQLQNLTLNGRQAPMEIADSSLTLTLADRQATLTGALNTPEGPLNIAGNANWQLAQAWFGSIRLHGEKLKLHLTNASFSFSPDLLFSAEPKEGLLSGEVLLENGKMSVDELPENAIRVSDDEVIRTSSTTLNNQLPPWKLRSDVRLILGENVRLAAFGLNTKLLGQLRIRQQGLLPTIHGQVTLQEGTFRAYGQDLQLRKGKLTFNGPADQPLMSIEAIRNPEKTEDEVIAGIQVDGLSDNPVIKVFSTPAKPQANALAYLLLGRDLTSSSSDKSVTTSLIGLGIASSGKLVGQLGEVFGLRELSLDTAGSGDKSKVMVSGYLSPKLQLKYGVGIFNQIGEFTLRYRLARKLFVEAVTGVNQSVDLLYQVEFD